MLSQRILGNFRRLLESYPQGANDSALPRHGIPVKAFDKGGRFDSADAAESFEKLQQFLAENLSPAAASSAETLLSNLLDKLGREDDDDPLAADDERRRRMARDARTPTRPTEAQREAFAKRFPGAGSVRHV